MPEPKVMLLGSGDRSRSINQATHRIGIAAEVASKALIQFGAAARVVTEIEPPKLGVSNMFPIMGPTIHPPPKGSGWEYDDGNGHTQRFFYKTFKFGKAKAKRKRQRLARRKHR